MLTSIAFLLLAANSPAQQTSLPRQLDPDLVRQADPWFDRPRIATDDPAFILAAVESSRQAVTDARGATADLANAQLRGLAAEIARQDETTLQRLEGLAKRKGWRLPEPIPQRASTLPSATPHRAGANFILHQISFHEATVSQFRAQIAGRGDAELKGTLRAVLPGYERNLAALLTAKP